MVGGDYLEKNLALLNDKGRLVIIGFLGSPKSHVNMTRVLLKGLTITGSVLRSAPDDHKAKLCAEIAEHVWPRVRDGSIKLPIVDQVLDGLEAFEEAHERMKSSAHCGKIVLRIPPADA